MTDQDASPNQDALDVLVAQLLACGGPLSQMIGRMEAFEASGLSSPGTPPVLEVAHSLIRDVSSELPKRHSDQELRAAAEIVEEVATAICENIFIVPPSEIRRAAGASRGAGGGRRQRRRLGRGRR